MRFEILVEDLSGKRALEVLMPKILGDQHSFRIINYRGVGHIPKTSRVSPMRETASAQSASQATSGVWA